MGWYYAGVKKTVIGKKMTAYLMTASAFFAMGIQSALSDNQQGNNPDPDKARPDQTATVTQPHTDMNATQGTAGMEVYIDPETGEIEEPPTDALYPLPTVPLNTKSIEETLEITESPTPDGGVTVDLRGHFLTPLTATKDAEGNITIQHKHEITKAAEEK